MACFFVVGRTRVPLLSFIPWPEFCFWRIRLHQLNLTVPDSKMIMLMLFTDCVGLSGYVNHWCANALGQNNTEAAALVPWEIFSVL